MFSPGERGAMIAASEAIPLFGWFAAKAKSARRSAEAEEATSWVGKLDFPDVVYVISMVMLFYFGMQHFPFGTRDELSLCALIGGVAIFLRVMDAPTK